MYLLITQKLTFVPLFQNAGKNKESPLVLFITDISQRALKDREYHKMLVAKRCQSRIGLRYNSHFRSCLEESST